MFRLSLAAGMLGLCSLVWNLTVSATADGPDFYAVTGVAADDVLNMRSEPSADAVKVGAIPHDARGLKNLGCQGLPSYGEWQSMSESERAESRRRYWCRVSFQGLEGWVAGRFLMEGSPPPAD